MRFEWCFSFWSCDSSSKYLISQVGEVSIYCKVGFSSRSIIVFELCLNRLLSELELAQFFLTLPYFKHVIKTSIQILISLLLKSINTLKRSQFILKFVILDYSIQQIPLEKNMVSKHPFVHLWAMIDHLFVLTSKSLLLILYSVKLHLDLLQLLNILLILCIAWTCFLSFSIFKLYHFLLQASYFLTKFFVLIFHLIHICVIRVNGLISVDY